MVAAIGGADMPVVISMLNSYSGWAAAATGFMLSNDLLDCHRRVGRQQWCDTELHHVSGDESSFHQRHCRGFRHFGWVFQRATAIEGEVQPIDNDGMAQLLGKAKNVMIVPGYGMATAQAQHAVAEITRTLDQEGCQGTLRYSSLSPGVCPVT